MLYGEGDRGLEVLMCLIFFFSQKIEIPGDIAMCPGDEVEFRESPGQSGRNGMYALVMQSVCDPNGVIWAMWRQTFCKK